MSSSLRDILNRARWRDHELAELALVVLHRGAPDDRRTVFGSAIADVTATGVVLVPEAPDAEPGFLPYHRFLAVLDRQGAVLWDKAGGERAHRHEADVSCDEGREVAIEHEVLLARGAGEATLVLDGSAGEGGGQILRTALSLSMLTGTPFVLERIRARRPRAGLLRQHLTCVRAAAAICDAAVSGAVLGSPRLSFRPGRVRGGEHTFDIGSAGSVALVLQTLALPLALAPAPSRVVVRGGTHARWAPIAPFLEVAWLPLLRRAGAELDLQLSAVGFHPAGGGEVVMSVRPQATLCPLHLPEPSGRLALALDAIVAHLSQTIAEREIAVAAARLGEPLESARSETVASPGPGNALWLTARDPATGLSNVFSGIGERGIPAEAVAEQVVDRFLAWRASRTSVEGHLADQLMLPIALAGGGSFSCDELSLHATTNVAVIRAFTGKALRCFALGERRFRVAV
jgi:RNA 3'-terminal phosphate cyclase (ATP)